MRKHSSSSSSSGMPRGTLTRRRTLLGALVLVALVVLSALLAYVTRDSRAEPNHAAAASSSPSGPAPTSPSSAPSLKGNPAVLPSPPATRDPIAFAKAAAVALWSYDTRAYLQPELVAALHRWLTAEGQYVDAESVERLVPSPVLWGRMADSSQFATAIAAEAHFPESFTRALQADPGAITQTYIYAVTVFGKQSISWTGSPEGGAEDRSTTLAVQCRPDRPCALVGVLPSVAP